MPAICINFKLSHTPNLWLRWVASYVSMKKVSYLLDESLALWYLLADFCLQDACLLRTVPEIVGFNDFPKKI